MNQRGIPALGRTFRVGKLYDAHQEMILAESLWNDEDVNEKKQCILHTSQDYTFVAEDKLSDKVQSLDIDASLELSFLAGLIKVSGSASYLRNSKSSKHISRVSLKFHSTQRYEEIGTSILNEVEYGDVLRSTKATHVVTSVIYGYDAFFVFDRHVEKSESLQKVHGEMEAVIKKIPFLSIEGKISGNLSAEEKDETSKFECTFLGDFSPDHLPTTFEEAVQLYHDLPKVLGISGTIDPKSEIGKPQFVTLYPISSLKGAQAFPLITPISGVAKIQVPSLIQTLTEVRMEINDLVHTTAYPRFANVKNDLESFRRAVESFQEEVERYLKITVPEIREGVIGGKKETDLLKYLSDIEKSPFGSTSLNGYLRRKKWELLLLTQALENMDLGSKENVVEVFPESECNLVTLLADIRYKFVFCCVFNFKHSTKFIEGMKKYLTDFITDKIDPEEKFALPADDKEWFEDVNAIYKLRKIPGEFLDLIAACDGQKEVIFAVTDMHEDVDAGDFVTLLYREGTLVCKDFNNTHLVKPEQPRLVLFLGCVEWEKAKCPVQPKEYIIWHSDHEMEVQDHTANKVENAVSGKISLPIASVYIGLSAVWEYGLLTDSQITYVKRKEN